MIGSRGGNKEGISSSKLVRVLPLKSTMLFGYYACMYCRVCIVSIPRLPRVCPCSDGIFVTGGPRPAGFQILFVLSLQLLSLEKPSLLC